VERLGFPSGDGVQGISGTMYVEDVFCAWNQWKRQENSNTAILNNSREGIKLVMVEKR